MQHLRLCLIQRSLAVFYEFSPWDLVHAYVMHLLRIPLDAYAVPVNTYWKINIMSHHPCSPGNHVYLRIMSCCAYVPRPTAWIWRRSVYDKLLLVAIQLFLEDISLFHHLYVPKVEHLPL